MCCLLFVGLWSKKIINEHNTLKRWEKRSFGCESIKLLAISKPCSTCPSPSKPHPPLAFQDIISPGGWEKPNKWQLLNSSFCKQSKDNLLLSRPLSGGKNALQFLGIHLVFAKRPRTVQSFKMILWDSKEYFLAIIIYGAASEPSLKKWGEAKWLYQEVKRSAELSQPVWMSAAGCQGRVFHPLDVPRCSVDTKVRAGGRTRPALCSRRNRAGICILTTLPRGWQLQENGILRFPSGLLEKNMHPPAKS